MAQLLTPELTSSVVSVVTILLGIAGTFLSRAAHKFFSQKTKESENDVARWASQSTEYLLDSLIATSVGFVQKTIVDKAQKRGTWDDLAKANAKKAAVDMASHLLGTQGLGKVMTAYGLDSSQLETFLSAKVEHVLSEKAVK
jgi:hypothetical protein